MRSEYAFVPTPSQRSYELGTEAVKCIPPQRRDSPQLVASSVKFEKFTIMPPKSHDVARDSVSYWSERNASVYWASAVQRHPDPDGYSAWGMTLIKGTQSSALCVPAKDSTSKSSPRAWTREVGRIRSWRTFSFHARMTASYSEAVYPRVKNTCASKDIWYIPRRRISKPATILSLLSKKWIKAFLVSVRFATFSITFKVSSS